MCHNYAQGVTVKTALEPDEVVFTDMSRQTEHRIGVSRPPHLTPLPLKSLFLHPLAPCLPCLSLPVCVHGRVPVR